MEELSLYNLVIEFIGSLPPSFSWVVGCCILVVFTFIAAFVFDLLGSFFGNFFFDGGDRRG